jgi:hypothetical protein
MQHEFKLYLIDLNSNLIGFKFNWIEKKRDENWCIRYLGGDTIKKNRKYVSKNIRCNILVVG